MSEPEYLHRLRQKTIAITGCLHEDALEKTESELFALIELEVDSEWEQRQQAEARLVEADTRRREGRRLLRKMVDRVRSGDAKRLAELVEQVDDYLRRSHNPADVLRQSTTSKGADDV